MQPAVETFTYPPEPLGEDEIRLIDIEPGSGDEAIRCKLLSFKRADKPEYKALSYAWGDVARTCSILVDSKTFWLHKNLREALYYIRDENHTIRLWTDRIGINQGNVLERNSQVRNMGRIYAGAEEVLIWLGFAPVDAGSLDDLRYIIEHQLEFSARDWIVKLSLVRNILSRPWFERLWVIQEVALAQRGTVILGHQRCDLQMLLRLNELDSTRVAFLMLEDKVYADLSSIGDALRALVSMADLRDMLGGRRAYSSSQAHLVRLCGGQRCQDPRDYIFATTGLAENLGIEYQEVDYGQTPQKGFWRFKKSELLKDVNALLYRDGLDVKLDIPSWIQNRSLRSDCGVFNPDMYFAGGAGWTFPMQEESFPPSSGVMKLPAYIVDKVSIVRSLGNLQWSPEMLIDVERQYISNPGVCSPYGDYLSQLQVFRHTIVADYCVHSSPAGPRWSKWPAQDSGVAYEVFIRRAEPLESYNSSSSHPDFRLAFTKEFRDSLAYASSGRCISAPLPACLV